MADRQPPGLPESFSEMVTQWERSFDAFANQLMGTEEFSRGMNQMQTMQLEMQRRFAELMARQLKTLNMPTREDVLRIGEMVKGLDERLARLEKALAPEHAAPPPPRKNPPRTKQPPSRKAAAKAAKEGKE